MHFISILLAREIVRILLCFSLGATLINNATFNLLSFFLRFSLLSSTARIGISFLKLNFNDINLFRL